MPHFRTILATVEIADDATYQAAVDQGIDVLEQIDGEVHVALTEPCFDGEDLGLDARVTSYAAGTHTTLGPLVETISATIAGAGAYETEAEVLFGALVDVARRYMQASGCDADLTAQALFENLAG